ncbi:methyltransferase [Micromonospora sp. SL1-18]|uniref:methyltransferase n=1 Tax=Micromonospora sp. SL1-18 TaxID=3399128 RepID=UPI003A4DC353
MTTPGLTAQADEARLDSPAESGLEDPFDVMFVGWSFVRSKLVTAALDLGVFATLGDGSLSTEELRERLDLHPRATRHFLDALAALGLLRRTGDRYHNSPGAARYLVPEGDAFVGGFLRMTTELIGADQKALTGLLRNGNARGQGQGGEVPFTRIFHDPARLRLFLSAMDGFSGAVATELVRVFDWARCATFSDIGGARGNLAAHLAAAYPGLTGTVLDRPAMEPHFDELVAGHGVQDRLRFQGGDFFTDDLPRADVLILGGVLHDWPLERRRELLRKSYDAVNDGGAVVVYDTMLDDERAGVDNLVLNIIMMMQSAQATGFGPAECRSWLTDAGFTVERICPLPAANTALIGRKN